LVNSILLENGYEEYRHKLARLGLPVFEVQEIISKAENVDNGVEGLLFKTGQIVFAEHLLTNSLPKDVADFHLSGDLHITYPGLWPLLPDTVFINVRELIEDGLELKGKSLGVSRIPSIKTIDNLSSAVSMIISLISKESSQEVVFDELIPLLSKHSKNLADIEQKIFDAFITSSTALKYNNTPTLVSFRIPLGTDQKIVKAVLSAYRSYAKITPIPKVGLLIDYRKGRINDVSESLSEIITLGGKIMFAKHSTSQQGVAQSQNTSSASLHLGSVSFNLPRLAFESNKDETYFRARLALLLKPTISSMTLRNKGVSDLIRLGINQILAGNTQYMQRSSVSFVVNLVGLHNAVYGILGYDNNKEGKEIIHKVIETAVDVASKKGKELGVNVLVGMTQSDGSNRFITLDGEKYGKDSVLNISSNEAYSEGITLDAGIITKLTAKSDEITECNKMATILNGSMLVQLNIPKGTKANEIKKVIEKTSSLISSFKPVMKVPICGNCGLKDEKLVDKCPACKSPFII